MNLKQGLAVNDASSRIPGADALRALACIWVLGCHLTILDYRVFGWFPLRDVGHYGVSLFLVLSGFLLSLPFWSARDRGPALPDLRIYTLRRLARIVPEYYLCVLVSAVAGGALASGWGRRQIGTCLTFTNTFLPPTFTPPWNGPVWSVGIEAVCYVLLPISAALILRPTRSRARAVAGLAATLAAIAVAQWAFLRAAPAIEHAVGNVSLFCASTCSTRRNALMLFAHFGMGVIAAGVHGLLPAPSSGSQPSARANAADVAILAILAYAVFALGVDDALLPGFEYMAWQWPTFPFLAGLLLCLVPRSRLIARLSDARPLRATAAWSFGIYLWHVPILTALTALIPVSANHPVARFAGLAAFAAVLSFTVALSYRFIGKPAVAWGRRLELRIAASPETSTTPALPALSESAT